ncbi:MAG: M16 family metallopeptidase [Thermodesulfovibrionales bacterium]
MEFRKEYLKNGIPVVMAPMKEFRSVSIGIWVRTGSRFESPEENGISHFLEHIFFKGTEKRTQKDIAMEIDSIGGELNAFTSKETTTFYIRVLDQFLEKGIDLLSDIFLNSIFPEEEIEKEKSIIKEEIKLVEDTPDDYIHDLFHQTIWDNSGLGQPILGRRETIKTFSREKLLNYKKKYYGTKDIVVSCAGRFEPEKVIDLLNKFLGSMDAGSDPPEIIRPVFHPRKNIHKKDLSEVHLCLGVEAFELSSIYRYHLSILNAILGGGVSSRLFQEIREKRGLAYSIYSYVTAFLDTGVWGVYAGTSKKRYNEVIELITKEMTGLKDTISEEELRKTKDQLKGNIILGLESTGNTMSHIARQEIYYKRYISLEETISQIEKISLNEIREIAERLVSTNNFAMTLLGPVKE